MTGTPPSDTPREPAPGRHVAGSGQGLAVTNDEACDSPLPTDVKCTLLDADGRVFVDLACVNCGYNLRTLAESGACPECGSPVAKSVGYHLRQPVRWLERVASAAQVLAGVVICVLVIGALLAFEGASTGAFKEALFAFSGLLLLGALVSGFALIGLTTPDPSRHAARKGLTARRVVRSCLLLLLSSVAALAFFGLALPYYTLGQALRWMAGGAASLSIAALPLAFFWHLGDLLHRVSRPDLVSFARAVFWVLLLIEVALGALIAWGCFAVPGNLGIVYCLLALWVLPALGILIIGLVLLVRAARALREAHRRAAALAATAPPPPAAGPPQTRKP